MKRRIVALMTCVLIGVFATGCANTEMEAPVLPDNTFKISFSIDPERYISLGFNPAEGKIDFSGSFKLREEDATTPAAIGAESTRDIVNNNLINGVN